MLELSTEKKFRVLMENSIESIVLYLLDNQISFGIVCRFSKVSFEPKLPKNIQKMFTDRFTYFVLANYTLESTKIENKFLSFEAGFGEGVNEVEALVKLPLYGIFQIIVDDEVVLLNVCSNADFEDDLADENKSIDALLANPENKKLLEQLKKK